MKKVTLQDIFNAAWQHFIVEQSPPATKFFKDTTNDDGAFKCVYLNDHGNKCAVGLCIPDGHPLQESGQNFVGILSQDNQYTGEDRLFDDSIRSIPAHAVAQFQRRLHDEMIDTQTGLWQANATVEYRRQAYIQVAKDYNLTIPGEPSND